MRTSPADVTVSASAEGAEHVLEIGLERAVADEIAWDPSIDPKDICVTSDGGAITLFGQVASLAQRRAAQTAAHRVCGVTKVCNELEVAVRPLERDADDDLASMAFLSLRWDASVPDGVKAFVRDGSVLLAGLVESQCQREAAEEAVARLRGVRAVDNRIGISPPRSSVGAQTGIEAALRRHADLADSDLNVEVRGETAVLTGKASTWAQVQAAARAAWSARGIACVDNRITVV